MSPDKFVGFSVSNNGDTVDFPFFNECDCEAEVCVVDAQCAIYNIYASTQCAIYNIYASTQ